MQLIERNTWRLIATNVLQRTAGIILNVKTLSKPFATCFLSAVTCIVSNPSERQHPANQPVSPILFSSALLSSSPEKF